MNDRKIDFIGIGAAKSGSSWLSFLLGQHPLVEIPRRKELCYFNRRDVSGLFNRNFDQPIDYYLRFWDFAAAGVCRGEFSPQYLSDEAAPQRIRTAFPDVRLIVILRNPVHRAISHFEYDQYFNATIPKDISFETASEQYPHLLNAGQYCKHLKRWLQIFPIHQFKIILFEDAISRQEETAVDLFGFLGLKVPGQLNYAPVNEQREIRSGAFAKLLKVPGKLDKRLGRSKTWSKTRQGKVYNMLLDAKNRMLDLNARKRKERSTFPARTYQMLSAYYQPEIDDLEALLKRDLSCWRQSR